MTPMLEAQNISGLQKEQPLLLLEENLEQLSIGNEEEYGWEDELEELSRRLQEPVNLNAATKRQLEQFPFLTYTDRESSGLCLYTRTDADHL